MDAGAGTLQGSGQRLRPRHITLAVLLAALIGLGLGLGIAGLRSGTSSATTLRNGLHGEATWAAGQVSAPAIAGLHDQNGRLFSLAALHGRTVAMVFFDSYCTQACPLEGRALAAAESAVPAAQRPVLVVVSVNPRDTPASTRSAVRRWGLAGLGPWYWLRGTHGTLARVWKAYKIFVAPPVDGDISHTEALYLLGRRGDERSAYLYPFAQRFVSSDLATLARQARG